LSGPPLIPDWIKSLSHPSYRNIFDYPIPGCTLWGTETLLRDWLGRYLLVAKDFYPSSYIEEQIAPGRLEPLPSQPGSAY
jgi:hypothetical protein